MSIKIELENLRSDRIDFTEFYRRTLPEWQALAGKVITRWSPTAAVDVDDLTQIMLAEVPGLIGKWDSTRAPLNKFVIFNAIYVAKREVHRDRKALRHSDKAPSRAAIPFSQLADPSFEDGAVMLDPAMSHDLIVAGVLDAMKVVRTERERAIMIALTSEQSYDGAARRIVEDQGIDPWRARLAVSRASRTFAKRMAAVG